MRLPTRSSMVAGVSALLIVATSQWDLFPTLRALEGEAGSTLHYPFEMGDRHSTRPIAGYVFKLPAERGFHGEAMLTPDRCQRRAGASHGSGRPQVSASTNASSLPAARRWRACCAVFQRRADRARTLRPLRSKPARKEPTR